MSGEELADVWDDWKDAVNMSQRQLQDWLETDESMNWGHDPCRVHVRGGRPNHVPEHRPAPVAVGREC
jgi:hypothetical protein